MFSDNSYWVLNYRIKNNNLNFSNKLFFSTYDKGQSVLQRYLLKDIDTMGLIIPNYTTANEKVAIINDRLKDSNHNNYYILNLHFVPISTVL